MPHIHDLIDFTVGAFIVKDRKVLLIDHKKLGMWLCPGGHIELDEDPEQAVRREIREETGLEIELIGETPKYTDPNCKPLVRPRWMDIHGITPTHKHVGLFYLAKPVAGDATLAAAEHNDIRWFTMQELKAIDRIAPSMLYYARWAIFWLSPPPKE